MDFTIDFLQIFFVSLIYLSPVVLTLALAIYLIGRVIGRNEGWSRADSSYYAFITATTVGYGDFRPQQRLGKLLAIILTFIGLVMTGIIVALAVNAATHAFSKSPHYQEMIMVLKEAEGVDVDFKGVDVDPADSDGQQAQ